MLLMKNVGLNSGFMIPQYTTAALTTENKTLCFPASADSIPTSLGQEDHVSMGSISARKLNKVLDNLEYILAIELLTACQAIELSAFSANVTPPTAVAYGESAGADTVGGIPKNEKSPRSPEEKLAETPATAAIWLIMFSVSNSLVASKASIEP